MQKYVFFFYKKNLVVFDSVNFQFKLSQLNPAGMSLY